MEEKWTEHKKWCIQARKDLYVGKVELIKYSGVHIDRDQLKKALQTQ